MRYAILALLVACGSKSAAPATPKNASPSPDPQPAAAKCAVTGCSGNVCAKAGADIVTTCEMVPEYACYAKAECKVQANGECGWTMDAPLKACIANPPPLK